MKFPCTSCGACCRKLPGFATLNRGDGTCRYYDDATRLCTVYDQRPEVCRIDRYYETRLRDQLDAKVFYTIQALNCAHADPQGNADMVDRTRAAMREAGYDGELPRLDAMRIAEVAAQTAQTLRAGDFDDPFATRVDAQDREQTSPENTPT